MKSGKLSLCCCNCMNLLATPDQPHGTPNAVRYSCSLGMILPVRGNICVKQRTKGHPLYGRMKNKVNTREQLSIFEAAS